MTTLALNNPLAQDYDGEKGDAEAGREYFKKRFARLAQKANAKEREIYIQYVPMLRTERFACSLDGLG